LTYHFEISQVRAWLREAGTIALRYYQTQLTKRQKDDYSPVTDADEAVEQFIIGQIRQSYSGKDYGILAEESGGSWQDKEFVWAIDPIDGTRIFLNGLPLWCISIGLLRQGEAYRGAVYLPTTNDLYYTDDEGHAFWNSRSLVGRLQTNWDHDSFIAVPSGLHRRYEIKFRRVRALGAIATHQVYVAGGVALAALHRKVSIWDIAGAQAILKAVGGITVHLDGTPLRIADVLAQRKTACGGPILAGHPRVIEELLPRIKPIQLRDP
jgi:myo-inositol-1(or 4)-monophosphatase